MKRKILMFLTALLFVLFLVSCSSNNSFEHDLNDEGGLTTNDVGNVFESERKIIYFVEISLKTKKLDETTNQIKASLENDEWVEQEDLSTNSNYIILRVKSSRLNAFVNSLKGNYETTNYKMTSTDVSLDYVDTSASKQALQNQLDRLSELYSNASVHEMIEIDRRISEVEKQLLQIEKRLNNYDSLIEYSTIKIWIYGPTASPNPPSYGTKLSRAFSSGWSAVKTIFSGFSQAVVFLVPLLIIIVPASGIVVGIHFVNKKRKNKREKDE